LADHPGEEDTGILHGCHARAVNSPNRKCFDQPGEEKAERENQGETVTRAAEMHQSVGDKREAKKAADNF